MKLKQIAYKLVLILLIVSLLTPEYAGNVLAATDTKKMPTAGTQQKDLMQPSPTPWNLNNVEKVFVQPTPTPPPNMYPVPEDEKLTTATDSTYLMGQKKMAALSAPLTDSCEITPSRLQLNIDRIKAKYTTADKDELNYTLFTEDEIKKLISEGAWIEDIYELAYLSYATELDVFDLWRQKLDSKLSWDELGAKLLTRQHISVMDEVYGKTAIYPSSAKPSTDKNLVLDSVYADLQLKSSKALSVSSVSALDAVVNRVIDSYIMQTINQTNKPQYSDRSTSSELVDPISGSLTWKENQISLPGRDGLDLNIGVMYNSTQARDVLISRECGEKYNYLYTKSELGIGWSFRFPSIQNQNTSKYMYYDGEGGVHEINTMTSTETNFEVSKGKERKFMVDNNRVFTNGQYQSEYYVEYADKKKEYFGGPFLSLLGIVDRYGNTLTFNYIERQMYGMGSSEKYPMLSLITDSVGRKVHFYYDPQFPGSGYPVSDLPKERIVVSVDDPSGNYNQQVTYTRSRQTFLNQLYPFLELSSITNQNGDNENFKYTYPIIGFFLLGKYYDPSTCNFTQTLLTDVSYKHSQTHYSYEGFTENLGVGWIADFRVTSRYDSLLKSGQPTGQNNQIDYTYTGTMDGYPDYYAEDANPAPTYTFSTKATSKTGNGSQSASSIIRTYNAKKQLLTTETVVPNGEKIVEKNTAFHPVFKYSPTNMETWEYGPGDTDSIANKLYKEVSYDDWIAVTSETRAMTDTQRNNPTLKGKNTISYRYESNLHLLSSKTWYASENDSSALSESYTYTAQGRVQTATNAAGETTSFTYQNKNAPDGTSRLYKATSEKIAGGKTVAKSVVTYGEETLYAYPTVEEAYSNIGQGNEQILKTSTAYDMGTGRVIEKRDGEQHATTYAYDAIGRLKKETLPIRTNANGERYSEVTDYNYYNQTSGNFDAINAGTYVLKVDSIRTVTNLSNNSVVKTYANVLYNGMGLALLEEHFDDTVGWVFTQYHYDDMGRPVYSIDPAGNTLSVGYDAWGRQNRATTATGDLYISDYSLKARLNTSYIQDGTTGEKLNYVEERYDPWGNKTSSLTYKDWPSRNQPISESYRYNSSGEVTGYTDPKNNLNEDGVTTSFVYDALNRLAAVKDALNQTTNYTYDGNGQLTKVTIQAKGGSPQTLNTKTYNELGLLTVKQDGASQSESYSYNSLGQLIGKRDRNGSTFEYAYDESGQLKKSTIKGTINNVAQTQETNVIFGKDNPRNQVIQTIMNNQVTATQTQVMDSLGQVRSTYSVAGNHSAFIGNQLDVLGRMTQINDGYMGFYTNYQYSKQRLDKVQTNGSSTLTSDASANVRYSYLANNLVKSITYPTLTDNSILKTEYTYKKALGWIESMSNTKGASVLSSYSYGYDNNGNQVTVSELRKGSNTAQTTSYGYDSLNRLVSIMRPDGGKTTYTYDVRGNRQTLSDTSSVSLDTADTSYTYDLQNTLTSVTKGGSTTSFQYYADGLRYMKTNGNTQTQVNYNLNGQVLSEEKIVGGVYVEQASFVRGDRVLVKKDKKVSKDYYYLYNGHGDVVQIVDTNGEVKNNYAYDEWGNITSQKEEISNSFKYVGESYDPETGLYYLRARYYDPSIGRFLNEDTYEGQIDNPLTQNLYTYVYNNPLSYSDPTGHWGQCMGPESCQKRDAGIKKQAAQTKKDLKVFLQFTEDAGNALVPMDGLGIPIEYMSIYLRGILKISSDVEVTGAAVQDIWQVLKNQKIGNEFDIYVEGTKLKNLNKLGRMEYQETFDVSKLGLGQKSVRPDYSIYNEFDELVQHQI